MRDGRRRRLPGRVLGRRLARRRRLPAPRREAVRARRLELRGARHQARALGQAGLHPPAALLQRAARRGCRGASRTRSTCCSAPASRGRFGRRSSAPTTGACARGWSASSPTRRRPSRYPVDHCGICDFKPLCDAYWDESTISPASPASSRSQIERLAAAGITTLAGLGARARRAGARRDRRRHVGRRSASRRSSSSGRASTGTTRSSSCSRSRRAGFALLPDPSPGDLFFDFEGNPFWDKDGSLEYLWGILDTERQLHAAPRARPRDRAARVRDVRRPRPRAARALPRPARLPLRAVRDHRAQAADGPLRHARGRARRPAAPRGLRRPLQGRPQRPPRLAARLRAEGARGVPRLRAAGRGEGRRHLDRRSSSSGCRRAIRRCSTRSTRTTRRTASRRCSCATGCSSGAPRRSQSSGRSRRRSRTSRSRSPEEKAERAALRAALLDAGEELAAQLLDYHDRERKPVWWAFFDRLEMTPAELVEDAESIGRLELVGEPEQVEAVAGVHVHVPGAGAQDRQGAGARSTRRRGKVAGRDPRARPRGAPARAQARADARRTCRCRRRSFPGGPY